MSMLVFKVNYSLEKDALNYLSSLWKLRYLKHGRRFLSENLSNGFPNEFIRGLKAIDELNHFMFYYYFGKLRGELGHEKFESLKEALTVFTNPDEEGYPAQRRLRAWLARQKGTLLEKIR